MCERLILKKSAQRIGQRIKWTSGARVVPGSVWTLMPGGTPSLPQPRGAPSWARLRRELAGVPLQDKFFYIKSGMRNRFLLVQIGY